MKFIKNYNTYTTNKKISKDYKINKYLIKIKKSIRIIFRVEENLKLVEILGLDMDIFGYLIKLREFIFIVICLIIIGIRIKEIFKNKRYERIY